MALEIERKFLLSDIPNRKPDNFLQIEQFYCVQKKFKYRIRSITTWPDNKKHVEYVQTIKNKLEPGVYEEHEIGLNEGAFNDLKRFAKSRIAKYRYIYKINKKLKWEVDIFQDMKLVVAEIEIPTKDFKFKIPEYIKEKLLMEVTEFEQFTNFNLSKEI
jgi:CYTH domain-containing protein